MRALDWDHNAFYQRALLRKLPRRCHRVLDVGCGAGTFAARLAEGADHVDAIDVSPVMIGHAEERVPENVTCVLGDVMRHPLPEAHYDAIVSITALHHLPLREALLRLSRSLRPGGVLAAVALPRSDLPRELPVELAGAVGHRLLGAGFAGLRAADRGEWYRHEPTHDAMPVNLDPPLTTREARRIASETLPGSHVRRLVFWRYLLHWQRPESA
ncbi:class I SAM-dependent methyltransferase [Prauserella flavalba]|uniref:Methyltransferase n=1 Tax=Prauserella flavalba TaxID=1477506 RepID=A0A318LV04_9PSEU|nr:class I SAM-dependent methyltransferase [Prauserella flavalba]PXY38553.1 methyltransferase [Prauserella flavalba]